MTIILYGYVALSVIVPGILALLNLSELGKRNWLHEGFLWEPFEGKEYFTAKGWQYKKISIYNLFIGVLLITIYFIIKG